MTKIFLLGGVANCYSLFCNTKITLLQVLFFSLMFMLSDL